MKSKQKLPFIPLFSQGQILNWPFLPFDATQVLSCFQDCIFSGPNFGNRFKYYLSRNQDDLEGLYSEELRDLIKEAPLGWAGKPILDLLKAVQDQEYQTGQERVKEALFRYIQNSVSQPTSTIDPVNSALVPDSEGERVGIDRETFVNLPPEEIFVKFIETTGSFEVLFLSAFVKAWEEDGDSSTFFQEGLYFLGCPEIGDLLYETLSPYKGFFREVFNNYGTRQGIFIVLLPSLTSLIERVDKNTVEREKNSKDAGLYCRRILSFLPVSEEVIKRVSESGAQSLSLTPLRDFFADEIVKPSAVVRDTVKKKTISIPTVAKVSTSLKRVLLENRSLFLVPFLTFLLTSLLYLVLFPSLKNDLVSGFWGF